MSLWLARVLDAVDVGVLQQPSVLLLELHDHDPAFRVFVRPTISVLRISSDGFVVRALLCHVFCSDMACLQQPP